MQDFKSGFWKAVRGIIGSIILSSILYACKQENLIPSSYVIGFTIGGFLISLATMFTTAIAGVVFTLGLIAGAYFLKDVLSPSDFIVFLVTPIVALVIRVIWFFKDMFTQR